MTMTTETVQEEILGTQIAETVRRPAKLRAGIWWCPFCDRSMQLVDHKVCTDTDCAAKLQDGANGSLSAVRMVIRTDPLMDEAGVVTSDSDPVIEPPQSDVYRDVDGNLRIRQLPEQQVSAESVAETAVEAEAETVPDIPIPSGAEGEEVVRPSERVAEGIHLCNKCGRRFNLPAHLARHQSASHGIQHPKAEG